MRTISILIALVLMGCATTRPVEAQKVKEADQNTVKNCKFLQNVTGTSFWGGKVTRTTGMENSKTEALVKASELGATHVVWDSLTPTSVSGKAYTCN